MTVKPECPMVFSITFARELIAWLGGDPTPIQDNWCYVELEKQYPELREGAEAYFASATTGNPGFAAYWMVKTGISTRKWAEGVIAATGNAGFAAFLIVDNCGSSREWAEGVIAAATKGNPVYAAHQMMKTCGSSREWAEAVRSKWLEKKGENHDSNTN